MLLPTPQDLGLPEKYKAWRPNQDQAIVDGLESAKKFVIQVQRTGAGKTVTLMTQALLAKDSRVCIATATKGLQDQFIKDWESHLGIVDIRGKSSYDCDGILGKNCEEGILAKCMYKGSSMCSWNGATLAAKESRVFTTNYSCLISANKYGQGFGKIDMLICDEAHNLPAEIAKAMRVQLSDREMGMLNRPWPDSRSLFDMEAWKYWALVSFKMANSKYEDLREKLDKVKQPSRGTLEEYKAYRNLTRKLAEIATCRPERWVCDEWLYGYQFDPTDVAPFAKKLLFNGIDSKVILTSGSVLPKTGTILGLEDDEFDFFDYPAPNHKHKSPLFIVRTDIRVKKDMPMRDKMKLVQWIDRIIESRLDRKGIIHTANFELQRFIKENSKWGQFLILNKYGQDQESTSDAIERYKSVDAPAVLVSPSVTTGYDFPFDDCRYQIIAKMPFPNSKSRIEQARNALDPQRGAYSMWQSFAQAFGRGDRADNDFQEVFVLDHLYWWCKREFGHLAPPYLFKFEHPVVEIPEPQEIAA